ncbi:MAG: hypothetical protein CL565_00665 [Alphaproteobacteria bacterium]|nr:hypothetical protein [Alphaproteobacteria bacterium]
MSAIRHFILYMFTAFFILVGLWFIGFSIFSVYSLTANPDLAKRGQADAIVVLTGGSSRVTTGLALLNQKAAKRLFISGSHQDTTVDDILEMNKSNPDLSCCIDLDPLAIDTKSNALQTVNWITENKIDSIILVTSGYHMIRARNEIDMVLSRVYEEKLRPTPDLLIYEFPLPLETLDVKSFSFWKLMLGEYNKTILSFAKRLFNLSEG